MIAIAVTGHFRPILYTHTTPPSPSDCLPTHPLPPFFVVVVVVSPPLLPPPPTHTHPPSPLLFFITKALTASVIFSDTSHMN